MQGTSEVVGAFRGQGYRVSCAYLAYLLREEIVPKPERGPGGVLLWRTVDVERLRAELLRRGRGPEAPVQGDGRELRCERRDTNMEESIGE